MRTTISKVATTRTTTTTATWEVEQATKIMMTIHHHLYYLRFHDIFDASKNNHEAVFLPGNSCRDHALVCFVVCFGKCLLPFSRHLKLRIGDVGVVYSWSVFWIALRLDPCDRFESERKCSISTDSKQVPNRKTTTYSTSIDTMNSLHVKKEYNGSVVNRGFYQNTTRMRRTFNSWKTRRTEYQSK